jgi:hypothetical protein
MSSLVVVFTNYDDLTCESVIAMSVFKFVEHPENNEKPLDQKCKVKFKIVSLKVKGPMEYVPELVCQCIFSLIVQSLYLPLLKSLCKLKF